VSISRFFNLLELKFKFIGIYVLKVVSDDSLDFLGICYYLPFFISDFTNLGLSLIISVRFARSLSILFIFSKNQIFVSLILCMVSVVFVSLLSALIFITSLFSFLSPSRKLDFLSYFFYDTLIIEQCVIQPPIICIFSAVAFVIEF
jgi:hypothetical protein